MQILGAFMCRTYRNIPWCCFVLLAFLFCTDRLYSQGDSPLQTRVDSAVLPADIVEALVKNVADIDPISLEWIRTRTTTMDFETLIKKTRTLYDCGFLEPVNSVFMWQGGLAYLRFSDKNAVEGEEMITAYEARRRNLRLIETIKERSFDGEICYIGSGHEHSDTNTPTLLVYSLEQAKERLPFFTICYPEYLACAGYRFPLDAPELLESHDSLVLYLVARGDLNVVKSVDEETDNPKIYIELVAPEIWTKKNHRYKFWLSKKLNYAVEKYEIESLDGDRAYQVVNSDFFQIPGKTAYLPNKCIQKCFTLNTIPGIYSGEPLFEEQYRLTHISTERIDKRQFALQSKYSSPGTMVGNHILSEDGETKGLQYIVPANPADLDRVIEAARTGGNFVPTPITSTAAIVFRWLLVAAGIVLVVYVLLRRFVKQ
ncbi:MAG: hypothetical protein FWG73_00450 [Planctomycetaceae bacterium]|nr:hypothetical protein [Planctomycetaceae bacterium]